MSSAPRRGRAAGYTLVELLVVMALLGVLASLAWPLAEVIRQRERERELKTALWEIRSAIDAYKRARDEGLVALPTQDFGYPPNLQSLVSGVARAGANGGAPIYFLRRVPRDPFAPADLPAEATWGLRSFQSPPNRPQPGTDVFDVYSKSDRIGLNGVPLGQW